MSKMIGLGYTYGEPTEAMVSPSKRKKVKNYPTVWINDGQKLPLGPDDVGKTFRATVSIHVTGIEERVRENQKGRKKEYNFELRSIQIHNERDKLKKALKRNART